MNGADALCETLLAHGIDTCFANPGTSEMHFVSALDRQPRMRCVLGLFEGVVTGAADGYARMADKPAATLLHLGSGLGNGLANLHNAKRANTPIVNIVGDHATDHLQYDAPLTSDIAAIAGAVSHWVRSTAGPDEVSQDASDAIVAAWSPPGQIATLILPADAAWGETDRVVTPTPLAARAAPDAAAVRAVAEAIRSGKQTTLLLGDVGLRGKALQTAGRIAKATGVRLLAQQANKRLERGAGRVPLDRVQYRVADAIAQFADTEVLALVGAHSPVAFFAYPDMPSTPIGAHTAVLQLAGGDADLCQALLQLADELRVPRDMEPDIAPIWADGLPQGDLTVDKLAAAVAALLPDHAIIVDEGITAARAVYSATQSAAPHDYLQLTGGAIGSGLPMATGAALACPDRKVVSVQADGSGMYTLQALWTQARERLNVVTIIVANRRYAILHGELKNVGANKAGANASLMLDLDRPELDWCAFAKGAGVEAARATTAEELCDLLTAACAKRGPFLIEAVL